MGGFVALILIILLGLLMKTVSPYMHQLKLKWIIGGYIFILVLSLVVSYQLPKKQFAQQKTVTHEEIAKAEKLIGDSYELARKGKLAQTEGVVLNGRWSLAYPGRQLNIASLKDYSPSWIMAVRKDTDDGKIEVESYTTKSIFEGTDFTDKIKPIKFLLERDQMILMPDGYQVDFVRFKEDFPAAQFLGERVKQDEYDSRPVFGQQILYLHIPKSLKINSPKLNIEFIKDNK